MRGWEWDRVVAIMTDRGFAESVSGNGGQVWMDVSDGDGRESRVE